MLTGPALSLLDGQASLVARSQLLRAGYTKGQIDNLLRTGHLEPIHHGVYRRTGSGHGRVQDAMAAVLRSRAPARITGTLVLALLGCEQYDVETAPFTLLLPPGRRLAEPKFPVRVDLAPHRHRARYGPLPGTAPARTILELALELADDALVLAVDRLRWRTGTTGSDLARVAEDLPHHPGAATLRDLQLLTDDRPETPGERSLAAALAGLDPPMEWQVRLAPDLRVDALWRDCSIVIEYDGAGHGGPHSRVRDAARDRRLAALGYLVVHVTAADLRHPDELRRRLHALRDARLAHR